MKAFGRKSTPITTSCWWSLWIARSLLPLNCWQQLSTAWIHLTVLSLMKNYIHECGILFSSFWSVNSSASATTIISHWKLFWRYNLTFCKIANAKRQLLLPNFTKVTWNGFTFSIGMIPRHALGMWENASLQSLLLLLLASSHTWKTCWFHCD